MPPINVVRAIILASLTIGTSTLAHGQRTAADSALRVFLGTANPLVAVQAPIPRATVRDAASLAAETQSRESAHPMLATQRDADGNHPMAQVGDTLFAFNERDRSSTAVVVIARLRFRAATGYDGGLEYSGWAYALDGEAPALFDAVRGGDGYMLYPWRLPTRPPAQATAAERRTLASLVRPAVAAAADRAVREFAGTTIYGSPSQMRRKITGAAGLGAFGDTAMSHVYTVHGPSRAGLLFTSISLGDDLSDHGQETVLTMLAAGGRVIATSAQRYDVIAVVDLDHDGMDEIVTRQGVIRWDGHAWVWPAPITAHD